jgi:hypothetical protein
VNYYELIEAAKHILQYGSCPGCGGTFENPYPNVSDDNDGDDDAYCKHDFHWQCDDLDEFVNKAAKEYQ